MIDHNNKNFILAIVLSMAIIFGWQYFYAIPIAEKAKQEAAHHPADHNDDNHNNGGTGAGCGHRRDARDPRPGPGQLAAPQD